MISSWNEWDPIKRVVVGTATHANWPVKDKVFRNQDTLWTETPIPSGPVPQWIIDETEEDLSALCGVFNQLDIDVVRPATFDFQKHDGMYNYCPRDRFLVCGDTVIDTAMMYPCRDMEYQCYIDILEDAKQIISMPRNQGLVLDAANILRLGKDKMIFLESVSGNKEAYYWLMSHLPTTTSMELCSFYGGVHIDSTIVPLREGLVLLNSTRVDDTNCPNAFKDWTRVYVDDVVAQDFYQYPYASKWIALNMLVVSPDTIIVDRHQSALISLLEGLHFTVIPMELRHSRTLGGGFHCVTLDLVRAAK